MVVLVFLPSQISFFTIETVIVKAGLFCLMCEIPHHVLHMQAKARDELERGDAADEPRVYKRLGIYEPFLSLVIPTETNERRRGISVGV